MPEIKSTVVNYSNESICELGFSAELNIDTEYLIDVYGDATYQLTPGDDVYFSLLYTDKSKQYNIQTSYGNGFIFNSNIDYTIIEEIQFVYSKTALLKYVPSNNIHTTWIGKNHGSIFQNGSVISIGEDKNPCVGVLRCEYTTKGDRLKLTNTKIPDLSEYDIIMAVIFSGENNNLSTSVTFKGEESQKSNDILADIKVLDICTGEPISGANVNIPGLKSGETGTDGILHIGNIKIDKTYNLSVTATNYQDSNGDPIKNESFKISSGE